MGVGICIFSNFAVIMAVYLTIDIGNSSAKAAIWRDGALAAPALRGDLSQADIEGLCAGERPRCAAVCSVADDPRGLAQCAERLASRMINVNSLTPVPVDLSAYATGATLGADRVAAMAGAVSLFPGEELLVVDCGTAITYDRVDAQGRFLGGNIAPGIGMRLRALHAYTSRLPLAPTPAEPAPLWGRSTEQALQAGAWHGLRAEIEYYLRQSRPCRLALTGGRALQLAEILAIPDIYADPDLVLRGLKYIIEYNENK